MNPISNEYEILLLAYSPVRLLRRREPEWPRPILVELAQLQL